MPVTSIGMAVQRTFICKCEQTPTINRTKYKRVATEIAYRTLPPCSTPHNDPNESIYSYK